MARRSPPHTEPSAKGTIHAYNQRVSTESVGEIDVVEPLRGVATNELTIRPVNA
jgi:hypothetical protein